MRPRSFQSILDECLAAVRSGEGIEACLERYPKHADRLRPMLLLATKVSKTPQHAPRPWARETSWNLVRQRAADLRSGKRRGAGISFNYQGWLKPVAVSLVLLFAIMSAGGATAMAAQSSLPDSPLYRVKLATEDVRLWFVFDDVREAEILMDQSSTRVEEIRSLVERGKPVPGNVLSALGSRNERAASILELQPGETALRSRMLTQMESQSQLLLALWPDIDPPAREEYTTVVAHLHNTRLQEGGVLVSIAPEDLMGGVMDIDGVAEPLSDGVWNIGGVEVVIDERTLGRWELQAGATAQFLVARSANGRLHALTLKTTEGPTSGGFVSGTVDQITSDGVWVAGQFIELTDETLVRLRLREGQRVDITLSRSTDRAVAESVRATADAPTTTEASSILFEGTIEGSVRPNEFTISGLVFTIGENTRIDATAGKAADGARVLVEASVGGTRLVADRMTVLSSNEEFSSGLLVGVYQGADQDGLWLISGIKIGAASGLEAPERGSLAAMDVRRSLNRLEATGVTVVERPGEQGLIRFQGTIAAVGADAWTLEIGGVRISGETTVSGSPEVGARVIGWGMPGSADGLQVAYVRVLDSQAEPAPEAPPEE